MGMDKSYRTLTEEGRLPDNSPIRPREQFLTTSGALTTPYPHQKAEKFASRWLIENAASEAKRQGNGMAALCFERETLLKDGSLPPASTAAMLLMLFQGTREA